MAIVSIADLLDRAGQFEKRLEKYYAAIRDESEDNGVRLLTYYLARHRRHLQEAMQNFKATEISRIKNIRLKYDVEFYPDREFRLMETSPKKVKGPELLEAAVGYDLELVDLYRNILKQTLTKEASELIESLIKLEEKDIVMLKKIMATHYF